MKEDVVGVYEAVLVEAGVRLPGVRIAIEAGSLVLTGYGGPLHVEITNAGGLKVPGHYGGSLLRRGSRTLLRMSWAYDFGLYERIGTDITPDASRP